MARAPSAYSDNTTRTTNQPEHTVKLQLRAIGGSADIDQLVTTIAASNLRLTRVQRGLPAREAGAERAYIDLEQATAPAADTEGSAA